MFEVPPRAPRLHAFLTYQVDVLTMPKDVWARVSPPSGDQILLDLGTILLQAL